MTADIPSTTVPSRDAILTSDLHGRGSRFAPKMPAAPQTHDGRDDRQAKVDVLFFVYWLSGNFKERREIEYQRFLNKHRRSEGCRHS